MGLSDRQYMYARRPWRHRVKWALRHPHPGLVAAVITVALSVAYTYLGRW